MPTVSTNLQMPSSVPMHVEVYRTDREYRRELLRDALADAKRRAPSGDSKGIRRISALLEDLEVFDGFVAEHGGDEILTRVVCARVANGESLKELCGNYGVDYGVMWEWLSEDEERLGRYHRAQVGTVEGYVAETLAIADEQKEALRPGGGTYDPDVARDKLRIDARFRVAKSWNKARYGESPAVSVNVGANSLVSILSGLPSAQVEARRAATLEAEPVIPDEEVIEDSATESRKNPEKIEKKAEAVDVESEPPAEPVVKKPVRYI